MSTNTVIIEDDDTEMVPVVVLDEDDDVINSGEATHPETVETIDLDDEQPTEIAMDYESEQAFVRKLEVNRLMDKIISRCLHMENSVGMSRVINKTLLPLYRDTSNTVKDSDEFKNLLKMTWKSLVKDPNHKFLHIKTLCEELKSGLLRRKVPFVTLSTELRHPKSTWVKGLAYPELKSSSRETYGENQENGSMKESDEDVEYVDINDNGKRRSERIKRNSKKPKISASAMKKNRTGFKSKKSRMSRRSAKSQISHITAKSHKSAILHNSDIQNKNTDIINLDISDSESEVIQTEHQDIIAFNKEKNDKNEISDQAMNNLSEPENQNCQKPNADSENKIVLDEDSNKENNLSKLSDDEVSELLVPKNHIEITIDNEVQYNSNEDLERIKVIEQDIAFYKKRIAELEEAEVTTDNAFSSPYIQCAKLKRRIVDCYKEICELSGNCSDLVKRRTIRMQVANGHPSGPAKRLEEFLNESIDSTGTVAFPDFADVVKCVIEASLADSLGWSRQQVLQEASALFRQCGQALRRRRQKREYRDLLSLVRDKKESDDPAENDPELLAKLEENKLIAKIKEEEILERYVNMENKTYSTDAENNGEASRMEFESDRDSSDTESDSDDNTTRPDNVAPDIINSRCEIEQCSKSISFNNNLDLVVSNTCEKNQIEISNKDIVDVSIYSKSSSRNPLLTQLLEIPFVLPQHALITTVESQNIVREYSNVNDNHPKETTIIAPETNEDKYKAQAKNYNNEDKNKTINVNCSAENSYTSSNNMKNIETCDVPNTEPSQLDETHTSSISNDMESVQDIIKTENVEIKQEPEPIDVQSMLDELGDDFVCTAFDFEDPFLVIEISSDGFSEDDL